MAEECPEDEAEWRRRVWAKVCGIESAVERIQGGGDQDVQLKTWSKAREKEKKLVPMLSDDKLEVLKGMFVESGLNLSRRNLLLYSKPFQGNKKDDALLEEVTDRFLDGNRIKDEYKDNEAICLAFQHNMFKYIVHDVTHGTNSLARKASKLKLTINNTFEKYLTGHFVDIDGKIQKRYDAIKALSQEDDFEDLLPISLRKDICGWYAEYWVKGSYEKVVFGEDPMTEEAKREAIAVFFKWLKGEMM